jgi:hypothetical protein
MDYRQHGGNELGINDSSLRAGRARMRRVASGGFRREALMLAHIELSIHPDDRELMALAARLERGSWLDRLVLACSVCQFRRRMRDRLNLALLFLSGVFFAESQKGGK